MAGPQASCDNDEQGGRDAYASNNTGMEFPSPEEGKQPEYELDENGQPILDEEGNPKIKEKQPDYELDENG